jgi:hypothetical protein
MCNIYSVGRIVQHNFDFSRIWVVVDREHEKFKVSEMTYSILKVSKLFSKNFVYHLQAECIWVCL